MGSTVSGKVGVVTEKVLPFSRPGPGAGPPPPPGASPGPNPVDTEGLAEGYWRDPADKTIRMMRGTGKRAKEVRLCSNIKAIYRESGADGKGWGLTVEVVDPRGVKKEVVITSADAETDAAKCMRTLSSAGLVVHSDDIKRHRFILNAVVRAKVPLAYGLVKTGLTPIGDYHVFARSDGVIEPDGLDEEQKRNIVVWGGGSQYGRVHQDGKRGEWISGVVAPAAKVPLAQVAIGAMLSGAAIPYLPPECEVNTIINYVGDSGLGKTTIVRAGASVHGKGSQTTDPGSFIETYRNTVNAIESVLQAANHIGACFDELKNIDPKAAETFAYQFATGQRKGRLYADDSSRPRASWMLPALSCGEITLADRANERAFRRQTMDAGSEARMPNFAVSGAFDLVGNFAERKAYAEALGAASATHYGFGGPEFIRFLLNNEGRAREEIAKNLAIWKTISAKRLGEAPSLQASRIASRLGSLVGPAALAAEVLGFPWGGDIAPFDVSATAAASGMFLASRHALGIWADANGLTYSTQTTEILQMIRAFYHSAPGGAFILCGAKSYNIVEDKEVESDVPESWHESVSIRGWKAMYGMEEKTDRYGVTKFVGGTLEYVDFRPDVLEQHLKESARAVRTALASLRDDGLLVTQSQASLRTQRRVDGRNTAVIRIDGEFFGGE
jgi:Domain of unknown function (DUF927)